MHSIYVLEFNKKILEVKVMFSRCNTNHQFVIYDLSIYYLYYLLYEVFWRYTKPIKTSVFLRTGKKMGELKSGKPGRHQSTPHVEPRAASSRTEQWRHLCLSPTSKKAWQKSQHYSACCRCVHGQALDVKWQVFVPSQASHVLRDSGNVCHQVG